MENILIVDKTVHPGNLLVSELKRTDINITFINQALQAQNTIRKLKYDLIIIGDRLEEGKAFDVVLEIKRSRRNRHTAVVCVGVNPGKVARNIKELSPYAFSTIGSERDLTVLRVVKYLTGLHQQTVD